MAKVYTQRFLLYDGPANTQTWSVSGGYRAVITSLICWGAAATNGVNLFINGKLVWLWSAPGAYTAQSFTTRQAMYEGDWVSILTQGDRVGYALSGYIFSDPDGPIGAQRESPGILLDAAFPPAAEERIDR